MSESQILSHVARLLKANPKKSQASIVEDLVNSERYQRTKRNVLSAIVTKYYKSSEYTRLLQGLAAGKVSQGGGSSRGEDDAESDEGGLVEMPDTNSLNSSLRDTYLKSNSSPSPALSDAHSGATSSKAASSSLPATQRATPIVTKSKKRSRDEVLPSPLASRDAARSGGGRGDLYGGSGRGDYGVAADPESQGLGMAKRNPKKVVRYADLGGIESILQDVREIVERPMTHPEIYAHLGTELPRGVLLHGPPGCGKTRLANAIAGELGVTFLQISAPEVVSGMSGESEAKIRQLFQDAKARAPAIIFIDEIDAITPKRENAAREMERRIVAQLLTCLDDLNDIPLPVMVIGATNRPDSLDQALRRAGRFDREICLNVPDQPARARILQVISKKLRLSGNFDFDLIASLTPGYVGADLQAIAKEAASIAVNRIFSSLESVEALTAPIDHSDKDINEQSSNIQSSPQENADKMDMDTDGLAVAETSESAPADSVDAEISELADAKQEESSVKEVDLQASVGSKMEIDSSHHQLSSRTQVSDYLRTNREPFTEEQMESLSITMEDFLAAIKTVQPSAKREGFATIPNVSWEDIGALTTIRHELEMALLEPVRSKAIYEALNIPVSLGVLLYGPPGCGKTLLAKAVANQAQANFISIKGPELLNKFVGESERAVRVVFQRARASSPCIIFFDEIDALVPKRQGGENAVTERVVNQLLIELDGLEQRSGISVIAATNRPDIIDPAMLRPGRLDKLLYVPLPSPEERVHILSTCSRKTPLSNDVNLENIAKNPKLNGFSGADISSLVREASMIALSDALYASRSKSSAPQSSSSSIANGPSTSTSGGGPSASVNNIIVSDAHFQAALLKVGPSVSKADQVRYERLRNKLSSPHLTVVEKDLDEPSAPSKP
jgi:ribosome biogenesis ATPase